ncbi:MAG: hypothetical protein WAZ50_01710 [Minisyncoccia bacterium]
MKTFSIDEAIKHGWALFKVNKKLLIITTILFLILSNLNNQGGRGYYQHGSLVVWLVLFAVGILIKIGWYKILLKVEDGVATSPKELFTHIDSFLKYLAVYILYVLSMIIGFVLLITPGFYMALKYGFAPIIILDKKDISIGDAFRKSAEITDGVKWKLLWAFIVLGFLNFVGLLVLVVGLLVSIPVSMLAYVHIYRILSKVETA